jgi:aquaporin Z
MGPEFMGPEIGPEFVEPRSLAGPAGPQLPLLSPEQRLLAIFRNFNDPSQEWRRQFAELFGTFMLVVVAAGGPMVAHAVPGSVGRTATAIAPGMMVTSIILFMGKTSGAHLNPVVSIGFWLRGDFPARRIPGYVVAQVLGALAAAGLLQAVVGVSARAGSTYPSLGHSAGNAIVVEALLTIGLLSVILGTASGAQQVGLFGALGVGSYIAVAALWAAPLSGASMNPVRTLGPDIVSADFTDWWVYLVGPAVGMVLAVAVAYVLRGPGGGQSGSLAAQGALDPKILRPEQQ